MSEIEKDAVRIREQLNSVTPTLWVADEGETVQGTGYWRMDGGVISYRRTKDGIWDIFSQQCYPEELIDTLFNILEYPAIVA